MKKTIILILILITLISLSACNDQNKNGESAISKTDEMVSSVLDNESSLEDGKTYNSTDAFNYVELDEGITITDFKNYDYIEYSKIIIPSEIDGKKVVGIGDMEKEYMVFTAVFGNCEIVVPDTVTYIGGSAFSGSDGLVKLSGGKNCKTIGKYAFMNCVNLTEITFIDTVTDLADDAFVGCTKWKASH